jgi:hypothetical protein
MDRRYREYQKIIEEEGCTIVSLDAKKHHKYRVRLPNGTERVMVCATSPRSNSTDLIRTTLRRMIKGTG